LEADSRIVNWLVQGSFIEHTKLFAVVIVALQLHYSAIMRRKDKTLARLEQEGEDLEENIRRLRIENDRLSEKSNGQLDEEIPACAGMTEND